MAGKFGQKEKNRQRKRWKKGESSSCNPEINTFRAAARNRRFQVNLDSQLTSKALDKHNAVLNWADESERNKKSSIADDDGACSIGNRTVDTFASNWTLCTNPSFESFLIKWHPNSAVNKDRLAVLAAVLEVIKGHKGKATETECFAALMSILKELDEELLTAAISLLRLVVKRLPLPLLKVKFSETCQELLEHLSKHVDGDHPTLVRGLIDCISTFLCGQESSVWSSHSVLQAYNVILSFAMHSKPRVRHSAQHAIWRILNSGCSQSSKDEPFCHPASALTARFCVEQLEKYGLGEITTTLHVLSFLKGILGVFPLQSLKLCCEAILRLMTAENLLLTSCCFQALYGLFTCQPNAVNMTDELNGQLITALYDFKPSDNDSQLIIAWLTLMKGAHINLLRLNTDLCLKHLAKFFSTATQVWLSTKQDVHSSVSSSLKALLYECGPVLSPRIDLLFANMAKNMVTPIHHLFQSLVACLSFQYHAVWKQVLHVLAVYFEVLGESCQEILKPCLKSLSDLRISVGFPYVNELEYAVGKAVRHMGPKPVLDAIQLDLSDDFQQSWLIPVLRDNVRETKLKLFETEFLVLDSQCKKKMQMTESQGRPSLTKSFKVLHCQIWSLLPGFCTSPTDLKESFKDIAKTLGTALMEDDDIRLDIMTSLRNLISKNLDNEENKAELSRFAKNFLPILFNVFTTPPANDRYGEGARLAVFETIDVYLKITDVGLCNHLFDKAVGKLELEKDPFLRHAILDILRVLISRINFERVQKTYEISCSLLKDSNKTAQKKAYRILEELCSGKTDHSKALVHASLSSLKTLLIDTITVTSQASKAPRLRCLDYIVKQITENGNDFVEAFIPEVISNINEPAVKVSSAAAKLCLTIGHKLLEWGGDSKEEIMKKYLKMVSAGFGGSTHMMCATTIALGHIIHNFNDSISPDVIKQSFENVCLLLSSKTRQLVGCVLDFIKMIVITYSDLELIHHLDLIMDSLATITADCRSHFRMQLRRIFQRLLRKFGYELIYKKTDCYKKLITYIHKQEEWKKRKQMAASQEEESESAFSLKDTQKSVDEILNDLDEESDDSQAKESIPKKNKQNTAACIYEEPEKEVVNLLDPKSMTNIYASKPENLAVKSTNRQPFKVSEDGRLIIEEEKALQKVDDFLTKLVEETSNTKSRSKCLKRDVDELEPEDDLMSNVSKKHQGSEHGRKMSVKSQMGSAQSKRGIRTNVKGGKKSGKLDPFAYFPLNAQALNKRKKVKFSGQFKQLVGHARRGAVQGLKKKRKFIKLDA